MQWITLPGWQSFLAVQCRKTLADACLVLCSNGLEEDGADVLDDAQLHRDGSAEFGRSQAWKVVQNLPVADDRTAASCVACLCGKRRIRTIQG